jgi:hypothetical protein
MHRMIHSHWAFMWVVLLALVVVILVLTRKDPKQ